MTTYFCVAEFIQLIESVTRYGRPCATVGHLVQSSTWSTTVYGPIQKCSRRLPPILNPRNRRQSPIVGNKNPRILPLQNWAFCKLPTHSLESPSVAD
uniref:Uncharacterized protein n=1 Tax=Romanomermis culicivorax TaxID=13658 RepID=A0A915K3C3_ROMCU